MTYTKIATELIRERSSTRTYDSAEIKFETLKKLEEVLEESNGQVKSFPNLKARFFLAKSGDQTSKKIGTYGVITGAHTYIVGVVHKEFKDPMNFGVIFERIILAATDMGLKTCWLGGTFNKNDFEKSLPLDAEEEIAIITPVGYGKEKPRVFERAMRKLIKADQRKPWNELFFNERIEKALTEIEAGAYKLPLEMVRFGPSASNKQPWRVIKMDNSFHFFLQRTPGYGIAGFDMQLNDLGIAKCHFELVVDELGLKGVWEEVALSEIPEGLSYVISWKSEIN